MKRMTPSDRKEQILKHGMRLASEFGWQAVTRNAIARACGIMPSTIQYHYPLTRDLIAEVKRRAVRSGDLSLILPLVACRDPDIDSCVSDEMLGELSLYFKTKGFLK